MYVNYGRAAVAVLARLAAASAGSYRCPQPVQLLRLRDPFRGPTLQAPPRSQQFDVHVQVPALPRPIALNGELVSGAARGTHLSHCLPRHLHPLWPGPPAQPIPTVPSRYTRCPPAPPAQCATCPARCSPTWNVTQSAKCLWPGAPTYSPPPPNARSSHLPRHLQAPSCPPLCPLATPTCPPTTSTFPCPYPYSRGLTANLAIRTIPHAAVTHPACPPTPRRTHRPTCPATYSPCSCWLAGFPQRAGGAAAHTRFSGS